MKILELDPTKALVAFVGFASDWVLTREWNRLLLSMILPGLLCCAAALVWVGGSLDRRSWQPGIANWVTRKSGAGSKLGLLPPSRHPRVLGQRTMPRRTSQRATWRSPPLPKLAKRNLPQRNPAIRSRIRAGLAGRPKTRLLRLQRCFSAAPSWSNPVRKVCLLSAQCSPGAGASAGG